MNETDEQRLYGLIEIAERQQSVAQMVIEGMANERMALATELRGWSERIAQQQEEIRSTVSDAMSEALISVEDAGATAATGAIDSLRSNLETVEAQVGEVERILQAWVRWLSWRFLTLGVTAVAALGLLWWLASCAILWWDSSAIGRAQVQKAQLMAEVGQLQANRDAWSAIGMTSKLTRCGPKKQPCIRVDESAGSFGSQGDFRVIRN